MVLPGSMNEEPSEFQKPYPSNLSYPAVDEDDRPQSRPESPANPPAPPNVYVSHDSRLTKGSKGTARSAGTLDDTAKIGVSFAQLEEYLAVNQGLRKACQTLPLTLALWMVYCASVFYHVQAFTSFKSANFIREGIEGCFYRPEGHHGRELRLANITQFTEIVPWIDGALVPRLQDPGEMQILLGWVRVTQTRGESMDVCQGLSDDLAAYYNSGCFPPGGTVGPYGPRKEKFELPESAFEPILDPLKPNKFQMWLEIPRRREVVSARIRKLADEGWLDLSTQELVIDGLFLNAEAHIYTQFAITFVLHREGFVEKSVVVSPLRGEIYSHWSQVFLDAIAAMFFVLLLYEVVVTLMMQGDRYLVCLHLSDPYFWIDISLILVGGGIVGVFYYFTYWVNKYADEVLKLGAMPPFSMAEAPDERKVQAGVESRAYEEQLVNIMDWFQWFMMVSNWCRFGSFVFAMICIGRFFRGFGGQPRMSVLVQTILYSVNFILHYCFVMGIVFANFALGGYILFGEQLEGWRTPGRAIGRMLLVLFQRFDYNEFHSVAPISAALWFTCFFVLVSVLLLRLLSAAIVRNYLDVRAKLGESGKGLQQQAMEGVRDVLWGRTYEGSQKTIPYDDLLNLIAADTDPAHLKRMGNLMVDRRLRSRADLNRAEKSQIVDEEFLIARGCDPASARRLLGACSEWVHSVSETSSPLRRLMILLARQISLLRVEAEYLTYRIQRKFDRSAKVIDRIDLKHAKSLALARRIRKAQQLPPGWTAHTDADGRRYLRQEETGLTSWTLPKHLL